ncbi:hypothetical protein D3C75_1207090 [compost metagenome]
MISSNIIGFRLDETEKDELSKLCINALRDLLNGFGTFNVPLDIDIPVIIFRLDFSFSFVFSLFNEKPCCRRMFEM